MNYFNKNIKSMIEFIIFTCIIAISLNFDSYYGLGYEPILYSFSFSKLINAIIISLFFAFLFKRKDSLKVKEISKIQNT